MNISIYYKTKYIVLESFFFVFYLVLDFSIVNRKIMMIMMMMNNKTKNKTNKI